MKRFFCLLVAIYCGFFGILPFFHRVIQAGSWILLVFCLGFLLWGLRPASWLLHRAYRLFSICFSVGCIGVSILSIAMGYAAWINPPNTQAPATVVVLGCAASEGRPSLMLQLRINKATDFLLKNPSFSVVATGGYDSPQELFSEAQVIERELIARGVSPTRIFREDASKSTHENFLFAAEVIQKNRLPSTVVVITDGFHQLRGQFYARRVGLSSPTGVSCATPWGLAPSYWAREWPGMVHMLIKR